MQVFDDCFQGESWLFKKKSITMHGNMNVKVYTYKAEISTEFLQRILYLYLYLRISLYSSLHYTESSYIYDSSFAQLSSLYIW
jgi:hypothetical protein